MAGILPVSKLVGDRVVNLEGEDVGKIEEIMLDLERGTVAYAVLSFGGLLGFGDKLFALPWDAIEVDQGNNRVLLDVSKDRLKEADGFDKLAWPGTAGEAFEAFEADGAAKTTRDGTTLAGPAPRTNGHASGR